MSLRFAPRPRGFVAAILCVVLTLTGCRLRNFDVIEHGARYSSDGERLQLASLPPRCKCVTLANVSGEPLWIESWFYNVRRGQLILEPEETKRVLFDWAGNEGSDHYDIVAWRAEGFPRQRPIDPRTGRLADGYVLRQGNALQWEDPPVVDVRCTDDACEFGPLAMDRVYNTSSTQEPVTPRQRGINLSTVLEVASTRERCGCMMLRNITEHNKVTLTATLNGAPRGQITVDADSDAFVAFDWAGNSENEMYVIEVTAVSDQTSGRGVDSSRLQAPNAIAKIPIEALSGTSTPSARASNQTGERPNRLDPGRRATAANAGDAPRAQMSIRLRDYITVIGQLVDMDCTPYAAVFVPAPGGTIGSSQPVADSGQAATAARDASKQDAAAAKPPASKESSAPQRSGELTALTGTIACGWSGGLGMYSAYDALDGVAVDPNATRAQIDAFTKTFEAAKQTERALRSRQ